MVKDKFDDIQKLQVVADVLLESCPAPYTKLHRSQRSSPHPHLPKDGVRTTRSTRTFESTRCLLCLFGVRKLYVLIIDVSEHGWQGAQPLQVEQSCDRASATTHHLTKDIVQVTKGSFVRWYEVPTHTDEFGPSRLVPILLTDRCYMQRSPLYDY